MTPKFFASTLAAALLVAPVLASAQQAFTSNYVNMRAGPAADYPVVATLPQGTSLMVQGCVNDFTWCDVQLPDSNRGWVSAEYLSYPYQGNNVPVRNWGATIGIPIVVFGLGAYWASHYRDRPWYNNQSQWDRPRPPYGRPPYQRPPHGGHRPPDFDNRPSRPPHEGRPPQRPNPGDRPPAVNRPGFGGDNQGARPQRPPHQQRERPAAVNPPGFGGDNPGGERQGGGHRQR